MNFNDEFDVFSRASRDTQLPCLTSEVTQFPGNYTSQDEEGYITVNVTKAILDGVLPSLLENCFYSGEVITNFFQSIGGGVMQHPNITKLYEVGVSREGVLYKEDTIIQGNLTDSSCQACDVNPIFLNVDLTRTFFQGMFYIALQMKDVIVNNATLALETPRNRIINFVNATGRGFSLRTDAPVVSLIQSSLFETVVMSMLSDPKTLAVKIYETVLDLAPESNFFDLSENALVSFVGEFVNAQLYLAGQLMGVDLLRPDEACHLENIFGQQTHGDARFFVEEGSEAYMNATAAEYETCGTPANHQGIPFNIGLKLMEWLFPSPSPNPSPSPFPLSSPFPSPFPSSSPFPSPFPSSSPFPSPFPSSSPFPSPFPLSNPFPSPFPLSSPFPSPFPSFSPSPSPEILSVWPSPSPSPSPSPDDNPWLPVLIWLQEHAWWLIPAFIALLIGAGCFCLRKFQKTLDAFYEEEEEEELEEVMNGEEEERGSEEASQVEEQEKDYDRGIQDLLDRINEEIRSIRDTYSTLLPAEVGSLGSEFDDEESGQEEERSQQEQFKAATAELINLYSDIFAEDAKRSSKEANGLIRRIILFYVQGLNSFSDEISSRRWLRQNIREFHKQVLELCNQYNQDYKEEIFSHFAEHIIGEAGDIIKHLLDKAQSGYQSVSSLSMWESKPKEEGDQEDMELQEPHSVSDEESGEKGIDGDEYAYQQLGGDNSESGCGCPFFG